MTLDTFIKKIDRHLRAFTGVVSDAHGLPEEQQEQSYSTHVFDTAQTVFTLREEEGAEKATEGGNMHAEKTQWSAKEKKHAARLMRVNHVGEICAQALYEAQKKATQTESLRILFEQAANEEEDHLYWTAQRLKALGTHPSVLNPFWYSGAFAIGLLAGLCGDRFSLGMMAETEHQVEQHLAGHLKQWPAHDTISIAILERMLADEIAHGKTALHAGGVSLIWPVRFLMRAAARVMTTTAYYI